jgi:hypothetical protein
MMSLLFFLNIFCFMVDTFLFLASGHAGYLILAGACALSAWFCKQTIDSEAA